MHHTEIVQFVFVQVQPVLLRGTWADDWDDDLGIKIPRR